MGAGLCLGGDILSDLQGEEGRGRGKGQVDSGGTLQEFQELHVLQVEGALQESFAVITDSFLVVQQEVSEVNEALLFAVFFPYIFVFLILSISRKLGSEQAIFLAFTLFTGEGCCLQDPGGGLSPEVQRGH